MGENYEFLTQQEGGGLQLHKAYIQIMTSNQQLQYKTAFLLFIQFIAHST